MHPLSADLWKLALKEGRCQPRFQGTSYVQPMTRSSNYTVPMSTEPGTVRMCTMTGSLALLVGTAVYISMDL